MDLTDNFSIGLLSARERDEAKYRALQIETSKTTQQRTQEICDRRWPAGEGQKRYRCLVLFASDRRPDVLKPERSQPVIDLWARDEVEAEHRYCVLCGNMRVDPPSQISVQEVPDDSPAPWVLAQQEREASMEGNRHANN